MSVPASAEAVFGFVANAANGLPDHPRGTTVTTEPGGPIGLGTCFRFDRPDGLRYRTTLVGFDPPESLTFETVPEGGPASSAHWSFRPSGSKTIVTVQTESTFVGPRWLQPLSGILTVAAWPLLYVATRRAQKRLAARMAKALTAD